MGRERDVEVKALGPAAGWRTSDGRGRGGLLMSLAPVRSGYARIRSGHAHEFRRSNMGVGG